MSNFTSFARRVDEIARATFAEYAEAKNALKQAEATARTLPQRGGSVTAEYAAKSTRAHADLLEARERLNKAQTAGNRTMARIIGKYAADAAEEAGKQYGQSSQQAAEFRAAAYQGKTDPAGDKLGLFDMMVDAYRRTANNPGMIGHWGELTGPVIEAF